MKMFNSILLILSINLYYLDWVSDSDFSFDLYSKVNNDLYGLDTLSYFDSTSQSMFLKDVFYKNQSLSYFGNFVLNKYLNYNLNRTSRDQYENLRVVPVELKKNSEIADSVSVVGTKYWGEIVFNNGNGLGLIVENNGNIRIGDFVNFELNGVGLKFINEKFIYVGFFSSNNLLGIGLSGVFNKSINSDSILNYLFSNNIDLIFSDNNFESQKIGFFNASSNNDSSFDGKIVELTSIDSSGSTLLKKNYMGEFLNNSPVGFISTQIQRVLEVGISYGYYFGSVDKNFKPSGRGFMYSLEPEGVSYQSGIFLDSAGIYGKYFHFSGVSLFGKIFNGSLMGKGKIITNDYTLFGSFDSNTPVGLSKILLFDGDYIESSMVDGSPDGKGIYYNPITGEYSSGFFSKGVFKSDITSIETNKYNVIDSSFYLSDTLDYFSYKSSKFINKISIEQKDLSLLKLKIDLVEDDCIDCSTWNISSKPYILGCKSDLIKEIQECIGDEPKDGILDHNLLNALVNLNLPFSEGISLEIYNEITKRCSSNLVVSKNTISYDSQNYLKNINSSDLSNNYEIIDCSTWDINVKPYVLGCRASNIQRMQKCFGDEPYDGIFDERLQKAIAYSMIDVSNGITKQVFDEVMRRCRKPPQQSTQQQTTPQQSSQQQTTLDFSQNDSSGANENGGQFYLRLKKGGYFRRRELGDKRIIYRDNRLSNNDYIKLTSFFRGYGYEPYSTKGFKDDEFEYIWHKK